ADTDLPDPDSPTMATISPRATSNERPSTARSRPDAVTNSTSRPSTERSVCLPGGGLEPGAGGLDGVEISGVKRSHPRGPVRSGAGGRSSWTLARPYHTGLPARNPETQVLIAAGSGVGADACRTRLRVGRALAFFPAPFILSDMTSAPAPALTESASS